MKLERYWLFKKIILMFIYVLVISRGYILLKSIGPGWKITYFSQLC